MGFTPFLDFSYPHLLLVFLNLLFLGTCNLYFRKSVGTFFGSFYFIFIYYFGLACDQEIRFFALKRRKEKVQRSERFFHVKTTTTTTYHPT